jgi:hypothetical protein
MVMLAVEIKVVSGVVGLKDRFLNEKLYKNSILVLQVISSMV